MILFQNQSLTGGYYVYRIMTILALGSAIISQPAEAGIGGFLGSAGRIGAGIERAQDERARRQLELERLRLCNEIIRLGGQCSSVTPSSTNQDHLYEDASFFGQVSTGDISITSCNYRTFKGYEFSVNYRGMCPYSVRINPETNMVLFK
jgi:hypothetical protein